MIVFGLTYMMMYAPTEPQNDEEEDAQCRSRAGSRRTELRSSSTATTRRPSGFGTRRICRKRGEITRFWLRRPQVSHPGSTGFDEDPSRLFRFSLQDRLYQGIYESSHEVKRHTQFWFENRNLKGVTVGLADINCGACSGGRVTAIPQDVTRNLMQYTALSTLPIGPFNGLSLSMVQPAAHSAIQPSNFSGSAQF